MKASLPWDKQPLSAKHQDKHQASLTIRPCYFRHDHLQLRSPPMTFAMVAPDLTDFLSQPFSTWQSTIIYLVLCGALIWVIYFIGSKYAEVLRAKPGRRRPPTPFPDPLPPSPFSAISRSARSLKPRSPLSQVTTAASTGSYFGTESGDLEGNGTKAKRRNAFWPLALPGIRIGDVNQSKIAQRRRASSAA